jgi:hypothetical protein
MSKNRSAIRHSFRSEPSHRFARANVVFMDFPRKTSHLFRSLIRTNLSVGFHQSKRSIDSPGEIYGGRTGAAHFGTDFAHHAPIVARTLFALGTG